MEYIQKSYGQGQASSEGAKDTIQALARDEVWEVPQSVFFSGHLDESLGVSPDKWMISTAEANTGVDLIYKPVMANLPLQHRAVYESSSQFFHLRVETDPADASVPRRVYLRNQAGNQVATGNINTITDQGAVGMWDPNDDSKNRIQIGDEERKVISVSNSGANAYVGVDKPFNKAYAATGDATDVFVGIGPHTGTPKWTDWSPSGDKHTPSSAGNPNLIKNTSFTGGATGGWDINSNSASTLSASDHHLVVSHAGGATNLIAYVNQRVDDLIVGKRYIFSVEIARPSSLAADTGRIKIGTAPAVYVFGTGWTGTYDNLVDADDIIANTLGYSSSNRNGWVQYNYEFIATETTVYVHLGLEAPTLPFANKKVLFDSIQLRQAAYDSRLYIGSPRIFSGIKFDLDDSTNSFDSMGIEFWGRNYSTGKFGWWELDDYSTYVRGSGSYGTGYIYESGSNGVDHLNRSGTIKWDDIGYSQGSIHNSQAHPNRDWNHWAKKDLTGSEPLYGDKINDLDATIHNQTSKGGNAVTSLTDPTLSSLYWIRLSVPRDEYFASVFPNESPGFIKNIKTLDGRAGYTDATDLVTQFDTTERLLPKATWDFRMDDPQFFTVVGRVDANADPNVWTDYTKSLTNRSAADRMEGFSTTFRNTDRYLFFGADYKFSGIEFNLSEDGSSIIPHFEYWNGFMWVTIEDLNSYHFIDSGSVRWDMDSIDAIEGRSGTTNTSYFSKNKWVKRDLRASTNNWGSYNYDDSGTLDGNPYLEPDSLGQLYPGDGWGKNYPGGLGSLDALNAPHHHLYWIRASLPGTGTVTSSAKISTVRMLSKPAFKYFERGTEPWNFNITGTDEVTSSGFDKHEFNDVNGQFLRSPSTGGVWIKNTSWTDSDQTNSTNSVLSVSTFGLQPALRRGGRTNASLTDTTGQTTELSNRAFLSAALFVRSGTPADYEGRKGSNYLLYQDKRIGLKSYESYGGGTSSTHNWHGARIALGVPQLNQDIPLYRYEVRELPMDMVTRVTVNGQDPITFTATDTDLENIYSIKQEKIVYDRTITSIAEAETSAESILSSLKPLTTQTIKKVTLEIYDYPVYKYNSATTATTNRAIPRVIRAGDVIKITVNDGNYVFTNEPFLVQGIVYDDKKSLSKLDCTQGLYPASSDTSNIWARNYELAKLARGSAQDSSVPSGSSTTNMSFGSGQTGEQIEVKMAVANDSLHPAENSLTIDRNTNPNNDAVNTVTDEHVSTASGEVGFDGKFKTTIALHHNQGAISFAGDTQDLTLTAVTGSGLNLLVIGSTTAFVTRDGGFTPFNNWMGRTVISGSDTYVIEQVINNATVRTSGGKTWANNDSVTIRKISSALLSNKLGGDFSTLYYDTEQRMLRARTSSQTESPTNLAVPFWGTVMTGFHGTKLCSTSGEVVITLGSDHGFAGNLTHKPMVLATLDPTSITGDEHATTTAAASYVVVKKFTDSGGNPQAAQWGLAGDDTNGSILSAEDNDFSVSTFTAGHVGNRVYMLDNTTNQILEEGTVVSVNTGDNTMVTTIKGWAGGTHRYYVEAQIQKIYLQVYKPALSLASAVISSNVGATDTVLVNPVTGVLYSSEHVAINDVLSASVGTLQVGVCYSIIPRPSLLTGLPFTGILTVHAGHNT